MPFHFVDICSDCGYPLIGSPDQGTCPECGKRYDQNVLILHGAATASPKRISPTPARERWA
jgi:hypothetical protein